MEKQGGSAYSALVVAGGDYGCRHGDFSDRVVMVPRVVYRLFCGVTGRGAAECLDRSLRKLRISDEE
jgi:hypothetical protein